MELIQPEHYPQVINLLASLIIFTTFMMLSQSKLIVLTNLFGLQGLLLAGTAAMVAQISGNHHLFLSAWLTLALKAITIPWLLRYLIVRMGLHREVDPVHKPIQVLLLGVSLIVFSYYVTLPAVHLSKLVTSNMLAVSLAGIMLGMLLMISRKLAITHVIGFMTIENGLFFSAVVSTHGMPMVVELGIAFDVLVATIIFGVFFFQIRDSIDSLNVDQLNRLREERE